MTRREAKELDEWQRRYLDAEARYRQANWLRGVFGLLHGDDLPNSDGHDATATARVSKTPRRST